jgi:hypothetical protein
MIDEKDDCSMRRNAETGKNRELAKLLKELKWLKKHESKNREYCAGVAASLVIQLKKILRVYNYSFSCTDGLNDLNTRKVVILAELTRLNSLYA